MDILVDIIFILFCIAFAAFFVACGICYAILTPILLMRHKKKSFLEALFYESLQSEFHLKDLKKMTDDSLVVKTIQILKYCKIVIGISLLSAIILSIVIGIQ